MNLEMDRASESLSPQQRAAIAKAERLSRQLVRDGLAPLVVDMFRSTAPESFLTYQQMAEVVLPEVAQRFPNIAEGTIAHTIKKFVPDEEERKSISRKRRALILTANLGKTDPKVLEKARAQAISTRTERIKAGTIDSNLKRWQEKMGYIEWSQDETTLLQMLAGSSHFKHEDGSKKGSPDWKKIIDFINRAIHDGNTVRTRNACTVQYNKLKKKLSP